MFWVFSAYNFLKSKIGFPLGFLVLVFDFFRELFVNGFSSAVVFLSKRVFFADSIIKENVDLALNSPDVFGWFNFYLIFSSVLVVFFVVYIFVFLLNFFTGSSNTFGAWLFGFLVFYPILEVLSFYLSGNDGFFVPYNYGLLYLFFNLKSVFLAL